MKVVGNLSEIVPKMVYGENQFKVNEFFLRPRGPGKVFFDNLTLYYYDRINYICLRKF